MDRYRQVVVKYCPLQSVIVWKKTLISIGMGNGEAFYCESMRHACINGLYRSRKRFDSPSKHLVHIIILNLLIFWFTLICTILDSICITHLTNKIHTFPFMKTPSPTSTDVSPGRKTHSCQEIVKQKKIVISMHVDAFYSFTSAWFHS